MGVASAADRPVETLLSGPASGVIGAAYIGRLIGDTRLVTIDMGGTSVDVSIVQDEIRYATENTIGDFPVIMPAVDVSAIGAGGGSIAWTDAEGVLKVGPESAGADPGPACYGRGGTRPAVTDAYLVAGIIAPDKFLGGEMTLDRQAAERAIDGIGAVLGLGRRETADAILQVTTSNIYAELLPQIARRGVEASDFSLIAYGAAGPTQTFMLARELNMRRVIVPPSPGILCALGCLVADMRADFVQSIWHEADDLADHEIQAIYARLEERARAWLDEQNVDLDQVYLLRSADACFVGQSYEVNVPFPDVPGADLTVANVVDWFHDRYAKVYGYSDTDSPTRLLEARLQIVGVTPKPEVRLVAGQEDDSDEAYATRTIFEHGKEVEAAIWRRGSLREGRTYEGPMVVEQYDTTIYIPDGFRVTVDRWANLIGEKI
jgi:N-methylhydantoinase A